ncbi:hypothetical protein [Roseiterribacter gracilis]|uniref:DUF2268 domain-containing protein n=1 Tax=Roseiterribacter gracilis TaxID=2812848 RepID=A0A8S8XBQ3_9PROT|nr:hypothetical protein TMPK1_10140 [Rhodospirillales bacterium TMPK1]
MNRLVYLALSALLLASPAHAACPVIDATQEFWSLARDARGASDTTQMAAFRAKVQAKYPGLHAPHVIDIENAELLERKAVQALNEARANNFAAMAVVRDIQNRLPGLVAKLEKRFPDFRCDFPIYLMVSLDQFDAVARNIDGVPSLVFGVDAIHTLDATPRLSVFLMHELFHRYHEQVSGFGDDSGPDQEIWRTLWAEGLATFVSAAFHLDHSLADALMLPRDLEQRSLPLVPKLAAEMRANADKLDPGLFSRYFEFGDKSAQDSGIPFRTGFYIGYRVASLANERCTIDMLIHWDATTVRQEVERDLTLLSGKDFAALAPPCSPQPQRR